MENKPPHPNTFAIISSSGRRFRHTTLVRFLDFFWKIETG
jgi:hypothetical protein